MRFNKYKNKYQNIGIMTAPVSKVSNLFLSNLINVLSPISENIYIVTGNATQEDLIKSHIYSIKYKIRTNTPAKAMSYFYLQLRSAYILAELRKNVDLWIFFVGGEAFLLPVLTAKLLGKKVVLALAGSPKEGSWVENDKLLYIVVALKKINFHLSDRIIIYSKILIKEWGLQKHISKISIAREHLLDFDKFRMQKRLNERDDLCGYIGVLEKWKGILNFIEALPKISERRENVGFLIAGRGKLQHKVEKRLDTSDLSDKVRMVGLVPHHEVPEYLNELKLLVLPSYTEGLPNIVLEAMACGTPVLATPVGVIPDIIKDGETGFIMKNNSPECIAEDVIRALEHPNLYEITRNAREWVEKEFAYETAVDKYKKILQDI